MTRKINSSVKGAATTAANATPMMALLFPLSTSFK